MVVCVGLRYAQPNLRAHASLALHQNHFHVDIRPPQWVGLPDNLGLPKKLIAAQDAVPQLQDASAPPLMLSNDTVAELRQDFGFTEEMTMFVPDMPNVPDQYLPVLVAEARPAATTSTSKEMTFGFCGLVPNISGQVVGREHELNPASIAVADLWDFDEYFKQMPEDQRREALLALEKTAKVTILQQPKYGTLIDTAKPAYQDTITGLFYNPKSGYMGKDQVVFLVEMGEYKIKLIYNIYPVDGSPENPEAIKKMCGKRGQYYKIASASEQLTSWFNTASLGGLTDSGVTVNSADLAGNAIGQTTGTAITQYAVAANATLTNGSLTNGSLNAADGWSTQGSVEFRNQGSGIGNQGVATLREVSNTQTRLNQVFMLGANDRYLSFTLSGAALDVPHPLPNPPFEGAGTNGTASGSGSSPSDAFEVALLNANTGASLLDNNGLTHSDAFLNLQADGTEYTSLPSTIHYENDTLSHP